MVGVGQSETQDLHQLSYFRKPLNMESLSKPTEFSNVALALGDGQPVCKHFQTGFCKFGDGCCKRHVKETCEAKNCNKKCAFRHPKPCKYFTLNKFCKFGEACCYKHSGDPVDIHLREQVRSLQATVDSMAETLKALEAQIVKLKNANKCDLCDYTAASSTALKTHITKKHKESSHPSPERERHSMNLSDSLNVSLPIDRREEAMVDFAEEKSIQCQWIYCRHVANSSSDMVEHVSRAHTITSTFVYPESSEKEYCDLCGIEFFLDHTYAMHEFNSHNRGFECDHCHEYLPGCEGGLLEIHMRLCSAPCGGDHNCDCTWAINPPFEV